jgi:hypothetical protein
MRYFTNYVGEIIVLRTSRMAVHVLIKVRSLAGAVWATILYIIFQQNIEGIR